MERSVILRLRLLGSQSPPIAFKIFDEQVAEPCGNLDADHYFTPIDEACLEWPYDPDFESEEYYEHENRLDIDADHAAAFQKRTEHRSEARRKARQSWPDFWIRVLKYCIALTGRRTSENPKC